MTSVAPTEFNIQGSPQKAQGLLIVPRYSGRGWNPEAYSTPRAQRAPSFLYLTC